MSTGLLQCFHRGCLQEYSPNDNENDSCRYHPGTPVFHDATKGWSCCNKKSTDFTEFLSIKGCEVGPHSNEKPVEPIKPVKPVIDIPEENIIRGPPPPKIGEVRPNADSPMNRLELIEGNSVRETLEKRLLELEASKTSLDDACIKIGTNCFNNGCQANYTGTSQDNCCCSYHPGSPIFHEGMKYWSCCQRKTSDFSAFLSQPGCEKGNHVWVKPKEHLKSVACRTDWHQTTKQVCISIFAKAVYPDMCSVEVNDIRVRLHVTFNAGQAVFDQDIELHQAIVPSDCTVKVLGTKVEINLMKKEPVSWRHLEYIKQES